MPTTEIRIIVPGSKSEAIRALVVGALAGGTTRLEGVPDSGDVTSVVEALSDLGVGIDGVPGSGVMRVRGTGGDFAPGSVTVRCGGSATGLRILACVAALRRGRTTLTGDATLRARPAGPLEAPLGALGIYVGTQEGRPPVVVEGGPARAHGEEIPLDASGTSQVASGMVLMAALVPGGLRLRLEGKVVSSPYIDLTVEALLRAGVRVRRAGRILTVPGEVPSSCTAVIEADWSSAAYPLVAAAVRGLRVRVPGLRGGSLQADRAVMGLLERVGASCGVDGEGAWCEGTGTVKPFEIDLGDAPDLAPAAAALALFAAGESRVTGAAHLRAKESDRIATCVAAVRALGGEAEALRDGFTVRGGAPLAGFVDPAGDHRIALAFGAVGAEVTGRSSGRKSRPRAWEAHAGHGP